MIRRRAAGPLALLLVLGACSNATPSPSGPCPSRAPTADEARTILADAATATMRTNKGDFVTTLDPSSAPIGTANFVALARCGFYDGITFHRVLAGFIVQAGDPQTRTNHADFEGLGAGDPGYRFTVEMPSAAQSYAPYTVAMANGIRYPQGACGPTSNIDSNGSQFFITLTDASQLCPVYSVLGTVTSGQDSINSISAVPVGNERGVPLDPVVISHVTVEAGAIGTPTS